MDAKAPTTPYSPATATDRKQWIRKKNGDLVGGNYVIPKGNFAYFLGYRKPTSAEEQGKANISGERVLEVALQRKFQDLGAKAMQRGQAYRNMYISWSKYEGQPGRERDMVKDGLDAIQNSVELNKASNMHYLEMQYKFQWASKSFGVISNLMKVRHESTKKSISEVR